MSSFGLLVVSFVVLLIVAVVVNIRKSTKNETKFSSMIESQGGKYTKFGPYMFGHPQEASAFAGKSVIASVNGEFIFYCDNTETFNPVERFKIKMDNIKGIQIEDSSTVESKISAGRLLAVGVFALAWKKKSKKELAFLTISFNDGRFDNDVVLKADSDNAMDWANSVRTWMIQRISEYDQLKIAK